MPLATQFASSVSCVLAMMIAPASSRFFASVASYGGTRSANASAPPVVAHRRRVDVVLERDRDAVQRAVDASARALAVQRVGDRERVRVHRDDRVELVLVRRDAREVLLHDLARRRALLLERASAARSMLASTTVNEPGRGGAERVCAVSGSGEMTLAATEPAATSRMRRIEFMRASPLQLRPQLVEEVLHHHERRRPRHVLPTCCLAP